MTAAGFTLMYYCESCERGYMVPKVDPDKHLLSLSMPCPNGECAEGSIEYGDRKEAARIETLTARILYEACMGMGFPNERFCTPEHLNSLLVGSTIAAVELEPAGTNRSIISSMTVFTDEPTEEGDYPHHKVSFAMSTKGATIFKVEELADV